MRAARRWMLVLALTACGDDYGLPTPPDSGARDGGPLDGGAEIEFDRRECAGPFLIVPNIGAVPAIRAEGSRRYVATEFDVSADETLGFFVDVDRATPNRLYTLGAVDEDLPITVLLGTGCRSSFLEECDQLWSPRSGTAFVRVSRVDDEPPRFWMTAGELVLTPVTLTRRPLRVTPAAEPDEGPPCHYYEYVDARVEPRSQACGPADPAVFCELAE